MSAARGRRKKPASQKSTRGAGGSSHEKGGGEVWKFILRFAAFTAVFSLVQLFPGWDHLVDRYLSGLAVQVKGVLGFIGQPVQIEGTSVFSPDFRMTIVPHCSALGIILFYSAAVMAFPAPRLKKAVGLALGLAAIYLLNMVRITTLYLTGVRWPAWFQGVHEELWPSLLIVGTLLICGAWTSYAGNHRAA
jgi:exosortase/archaeosortase family protein